MRRAITGYSPLGGTVREPEVFDARDPEGLEAEADAEDLAQGFGPKTIARWQRDRAWAIKQAEAERRHLERLTAERDAGLEHDPEQLTKVERRIATWELLAGEYGGYIAAKPPVTTTDSERAAAEEEGTPLF